jgi:hypothetical protein
MLPCIIPGHTHTCDEGKGEEEDWWCWCIEMQKSGVKGKRERERGEMRVKAWPPSTVDCVNGEVDDAEAAKSGRQPHGLERLVNVDPSSAEPLFVHSALNRCGGWLWWWVVVVVSRRCVFNMG